ncbi:MAG: hypothetical protein V4642_07275 [Bacteroidota bacterium]
MTFVKLFVLAVIVFFFAITVVVISQEVHGIVGILFFAAVATGVYFIVKNNFQKV